MMAASFDLTKLVGNNMTPENKRFIDQFNAMDGGMQQEMLRKAQIAARERLSQMLALARRVS